jgi:hypothetical protein
VIDFKQVIGQSMTGEMGAAARCRRQRPGEAAQRLSYPAVSFGVDKRTNTEIVEHA